MVSHDTPNSTNISRIEYNAEDASLFITFRNGKKYKYSDVSPDTWNQFVDAESAGKFFAARIKNAYQGQPV